MGPKKKIANICPGTPLHPLPLLPNVLLPFLQARGSERSKLICTAHLCRLKHHKFLFPSSPFYFISFIIVYDLCTLLRITTRTGSSLVPDPVCILPLPKALFCGIIIGSYFLMNLHKTAHFTRCLSNVTSQKTHLFG